MVENKTVLPSQAQGPSHGIQLDRTEGMVSISPLAVVGPLKGSYTVVFLLL
jgi:hypothetical protein